MTKKVKILQQWLQEHTNADESVHSEVTQLADFLFKLDICW